MGAVFEPYKDIVIALFEEDFIEVFAKCPGAQTPNLAKPEFH